MSLSLEMLRMPYPGLRPFDAGDQMLFFGREVQVEALLRQLEDHRVVAVVGSSGSGKSSLVRAGLLPAVREGFLLHDDDWLILVIKPGHEPYRRLADELIAAIPSSAARGEEPRPVAGETEVAATLADLRRADRGFLDELERRAVAKRTMIVVDQFEELFAFRRDNARAEEVASRDEAAAFVKMLLRSSADTSGRVWVVLTMRSDFIGHCEAFLGLPEVISRSQFLVPRLDRRQMEEAITRPGEVAGAAFEPFTFEEGLVNRIVNDAGDRPDQLPLMQHALMRTWKLAVERCAARSQPVKLAHNDYVKAGRIDGALSLHADAAWDKIKDDPKKANIARHLFLLLCDISPDGQITRRRPRVKEVEFVTGASVEEIGNVIAALNEDDRNFLVLSGRMNSETIVDISHEALLRQWQLFAGEWLAEERNDAFELKFLTELSSVRFRGLLSPQQVARVVPWRQRVTAAWGRRYVSQEAWQRALQFVDDSEREAEKSARRKTRNTIVVGAILAFATVASLVLMIQAVRSRLTADHERLLALEARSRALDSARVAVEARDAARKASEEASAASDGLKRAIANATELAKKETAARIAAESAIVSAKAHGYWLPLQFNDAAAVPYESNALLKVARSEPKVRQRFVSLVLTDESVAKRFVANPRGVVTASVGLSTSIRDSLLRDLSQSPAAADAPGDIQRARALLAVFLSPDVLDQLLAEIAATRDRTQLRALGPRLAAAVAEVAAPNVRATMERLLGERKKALDANQRQAFDQALTALALSLAGAPDWLPIDALVPPLKSVSDAGTRRLLGQQLVAVTGKLGAAEAAAWADRLVDEIRTTSGELANEALGHALAVAAGKLSEAESTILANRLMAELKMPRTSIPQARALAQGLRPAVSTIDALASAVKSATVSERGMESLRQALTIVGGKLPGDPTVAELLRDLGGVSEEGQREGLPPSRPATAATIDGLLIAIRGTTDARLIMNLGRHFDGAARTLNDEQAALAAKQLLRELGTEISAAQREAFAQGLAAVAPKVPEAHPAWPFEGVLTAIGSTTDPPPLQVFGQRLAALIAIRRAQDVTPMIERLLREISQRDDEDQLAALGQGLAAGVEKLDDEQARSIRSQLSDAIRDAADGSQRAALAAGWAATMRTLDAIFTTPLKGLDPLDGDAVRKIVEDRLVVVCNRLPVEETATTVDRLLDEIRTPRERDALNTRARGLALLLPRLSEGDAASRIPAVITAIKDPRNHGVRGRLGEGLAAMLSKLPVARTLSDTESSSIVEGLVLTIRGTTTGDTLAGLSEALALVVAKLADAQMESAVDTMLVAAKPADPEQPAPGQPRPPSRLGRASVPRQPEPDAQPRPVSMTSAQAKAIGQGLTAVVRRLPAARAVTAFDKMLAQIKAPTSPPFVAILGQNLAALIERIAETPSAGSIVDPLLVAIKESETPGQRQALKQGLMALAGKADEKRAMALTEKLVAAIEGSSKPDQIQPFGEALNVAAKRLVAEPAVSSLANRLISAVKAAPDATQMAAFAQTLPPLIVRMKRSEALTRDVVEVLKYPSVPHEELIESMRRHFSGMPAAAQGRWATATWIGAQRFSGVDLNASPR